MGSDRFFVCDLINFSGKVKDVISFFFFFFKYLFLNFDKVVFAEILMS